MDVAFKKNRVSRWLATRREVPMLLLGADMSESENLPLKMLLRLNCMSRSRCSLWASTFSLDLVGELGAKFKSALRDRRVPKADTIYTL